MDEMRNISVSGSAPDQKVLARTSTKLGIVMLGGWVLPMIGFPLGVTGLVLGIIGFGSSRRDLARAGVFLNTLGLSLTVINMTVSFYLFATGQLDPFLFTP